MTIHGPGSIFSSKYRLLEGRRWGIDLQKFALLFDGQPNGSGVNA